MTTAQGPSRWIAGIAEADTLLCNIYGNCSCEYMRLRWNVMSYYGGINAMNAVLTPGQAARVATYRPYRTNVFQGGTTLSRGCVFTQGTPSTLTLLAPSAPNAAYVTLPCLSSPLPIVSGIATTGGGGEFRLILVDPVLLLALSPAGTLLASGILGTTDGAGTAATTVTVPTIPPLTGLVLYWQSAVAGPSRLFASQVLPVTFQ